MLAPSLVDAEALRRQRLLNWLQSAVLLLGLLALAAITGALFAGTDGLIVAAAIAAGFLVLNPVSGDVVFRYIYGAVPLTPASAPRLSCAGRRARAPGRASTAPRPVPDPDAGAAGYGVRQPRGAVDRGHQRPAPDDVVARARCGARARDRAHPPRRHVRHARRGGRRLDDARDVHRRHVPADRVLPGLVDHRRRRCRRPRSPCSSGRPW